LFRAQKIRCVLVHDHVLLREGVRRLLEDEADLDVVGEAGSVGEALQKIAQHRPEIVIADPQIFQTSAEQAEWAIVQQSPLSKVLFLRTDPGESGAGSEIRCVVRQTSAEELIEMVHRAHYGERNVREMPRRTSGEPSKLRTRKRVLTAREREVLKLLAEGRTVRTTADILGLSVKTVDAHKFNLMRKLGLHNKTELVMWAIQKRVVKLPVNF
jgi:two-component system response regulator NreC